MASFCQLSTPRDYRSANTLSWPGAFRAAVGKKGLKQLTMRNFRLLPSFNFAYLEPAVQHCRIGEAKFLHRSPWPG